MSLIQHGVRVGLLMVGVAGLLLWQNYHAEVSFADGLRYIHQAERIDSGQLKDGLLKATDHPLHPLAIVAVHHLLRGEGPVAWQRAAQGAALLAGVLLVIPLYLIALEVYGPNTAWLGALLTAANPIVAYVILNVLSESTFLLFWTWGLWGALRFLREGRFVWLVPTTVFGALAYLARPEGLLLPLALIATLLILPLHRATRIYWPRWWAAVGVLVIGPLLLVGPYVAAKGGLGTKPSIARLIGTAPKADPTALERERPLPPGQTAFHTYRVAVRRTVKVFRGAVGIALLPLTLLGLWVARPWTPRARVWLFTTILVFASAAALVRLYATGGYLTLRHALVPSMLLTLAAAHGLAWLMKSIAVEGRWFGLPEGRLRPGPGVWALLLLLYLGQPYYRAMTPYQGSFAAYRDAGDWLARTKDDHGKIADLTDWSLYFSGRPGFNFANVHWAAVDPTTRWVVIRDAHLAGHWNYSRTVHQMVDGLEPVAVFPAHRGAHQVQIRIYDRQARPTQIAAKSGVSKVK